MTKMVIKFIHKDTCRIYKFVQVLKGVESQETDTVLKMSK